LNQFEMKVKGIGILTTPSCSVCRPLTKNICNMAAIQPPQLVGDWTTELYCKKISSEKANGSADTIPTRTTCELHAQDITVHIRRFPSLYQQRASIKMFHSNETSQASLHARETIHRGAR